MNLEIMSVFTICAGVYIVARIVNWIESEKKQKEIQVIEEERLEKIANLYGRSNKGQ
tara:strand:+ start:309 stop:479 length:171 start_codon:yes stop_codon:yes gene_type:complete